MNIGLDFDDTYTRDPASWDKMIELFRTAGHKVYITTWRMESELNPVRAALTGKTDGIYATHRMAKSSFMFAQGICIDVWIDDYPIAILKNMEGYEAFQPTTFAK